MSRPTFFFLVQEAVSYSQVTIRNKRLSHLFF